ncbi:MAG: antibiotic biosynthesis monooxygenase [Flavobacteriales bacterium]|nr:antibiotic biosynthesis monooxygenase [Flavobacteriales bacterium]
MNRPMKIIRTWKGWTTKENAPVYEAMLINEVFPAVKRKGVDGLEKVSISTANREDEVEFFLVLQFDSLDAVKQFAGENYRQAYIPENAQRVLKRYDRTAEHFELKEELILN